MDFLNRDNRATVDRIGDMVGFLHSKLDRNLSADAGKAVLSMESNSPAYRSAVSTATDLLSTSMESMLGTLEIESKDFKITKAQKEAGIQAGILASNWSENRKRSLRDNLPRDATDKNMITLEAYRVPGALRERSYAAEAYDERENRSAVAYSITYNMQSSRQDDFGETLFPTITIPADQAGVVITTNIMYVLDNIDRSIEGDFYDLKRKNILRAAVDPTIFHKDQTRVIPVFRNAASDKFVAGSAVAPYDYATESGDEFQTAPLAVGQRIDLIGLSQTEASLNGGVANRTDTLDPTINLTNVYVAFGSQIVRFPTKNLPGFNFVPSAQGDYKTMVLNGSTDSVLLNKDSKKANGDALAAPLATIATDDYVIRVRMVVTGSVRLDTANIEVYGNTFKVYSIWDTEDNKFIALDDPAVASLVTAINSSTIIGYDVEAFLTNANRRMQGQFIDVAKSYQRYQVPLRSPISTIHPSYIDSSIDSSDVQALITATRMRINTEAVTTLLSAQELLKSYVDVRDLVGEGPELLGVGRHFVRAAYTERNFDAAESTDSIRSYERAQDIAGAIINELRDIAYSLYRDSEYKAAADAIYGGQGPIPSIVIATDPYIARYINVSGDLRTLGGEFDVKVVSTLDYRMRGKVIITLGQFEAERNSAINPLNFGNLLWAPELVLTANISRQNTYNHETLVQPRYLFIVNLPIMGYLKVVNIANALSKQPINVVDVTPAAPVTP